MSGHTLHMWQLSAKCWIVKILSWLEFLLLSFNVSTPNLSQWSFTHSNWTIFLTLVGFLQGVSRDRFLGHTHAPCTSRFRCARTRVRTSHLKWSHFAPSPALLITSTFFSTFFQHFFSNFSIFFNNFSIFFNIFGCSKQNKVF